MSRVNHLEDTRVMPTVVCPFCCSTSLLTKEQGRTGLVVPLGSAGDDTVLQGGGPLPLLTVTSSVLPPAIAAVAARTERSCLPRQRGCGNC